MGKAVKLSKLLELNDGELPIITGLGDTTKRVVATALYDDLVPVDILNKVGKFSTIQLKNNQITIVPNEFIEEVTIADAIERFKPILDHYFPGRWYYNREQYNHLFLCYPKLTITNDLGMSHTIYDLIVALNDFGYQTGAFNGISGMRASFSAAELYHGYIHSHLPSGGGSSFQSFCTGGNSQFSNALENTFRRGKTSAKEFELFLLQLQSYLEWESLRGTPHILMSTVLGNTVEENGDQTIGNITMRETVLPMILEFLENNPDFVKKNNSSIWIEPAVNPELFLSFEQSLAGVVEMVDYDTLTGNYVGSVISSSQASLPGVGSVWLRLFEKLGIQRRIIQEDKIQVSQSSIIKRISKADMKYINEVTSTFLTNVALKYVPSTGSSIQV